MSLIEAIQCFRWCTFGGVCKVQKMLWIVDECLLLEGVQSVLRIGGVAFEYGRSHANLHLSDLISSWILILIDLAFSACAVGLSQDLLTAYRLSSSDSLTI